MIYLDLDLDLDLDLPKVPKIVIYAVLSLNLSTFASSSKIELLALFQAHRLILHHHSVTLNPTIRMQLFNYARRIFNYFTELVNNQNLDPNTLPSIGTSRKRKRTDEKLDETNKKKHKCNFCEHTTNQSRDLRIHIRVHTGEKPYKCNFCDYESTQSSNLKTHIKRMHRGEKNI